MAVNNQELPMKCPEHLLPRFVPQQEFNPTTYVWFYGRIPRDEAEKRLQNCRNGAFLVRESNNYQGDYTLSIQYESRVEHYRIMRKEHSYFTIDEELYFENIVKLVEHYRQGSYGLCTRLKDVPSETDIISHSEKIAPETLLKQNCISKKQPQAIEVWQGEMLNEKVVFKVFKCSKKDYSKLSSKVGEESSMLSSLRHENLVSFLGIGLKEPSIYFVTEYMTKGSFVEYLKSRGRRYISKQSLLDFAGQICSGMRYLESMKIVHGNLAAHNVLLGNDGKVKVTDFGMTHITEEILLLKPLKAVIRWRAPEVISAKQFSSKADVWSFGVVLWEIYSFGRVPYPGKTAEEVPPFVESGDHMSPPDDCPDKVYALMQNTWQKGPDCRPTFSQVYKQLQSIYS